MNTKMLLEKFQKALAREEKAKHFYDHYIDSVDEGEIKKQLLFIRDDERVHIEIARKLINYVS